MLLINVQLGLALIGMFTMFFVGVERTENEILCTVMSLTIQYFTLTSAFLMGASSILLFRLIVIVFAERKKAFLIISSITCWGKDSAYACEFRIIMFLNHVVLPLFFNAISLATLGTGNNYLTFHSNETQL